MGFSPCSSSSVSTITADHHHPETAAAIKNKRMIVFALVAPNQKKERKSPPPPRRPTTSTSVSVLKLDDESVAENVISRLNLSGCAVVSKGVLVVEGPTGSVNRFSKLMGLAQKRPDSVIWRARVRRPRFEIEGDGNVAWIMDSFTPQKWSTNTKVALVLFGYDLQGSKSAASINAWLCVIPQWMIPLLFITNWDSSIANNRLYETFSAS